MGLGAETHWLVIACGLAIPHLLLAQLQSPAPRGPGASPPSATSALARGLVEDSRRLGELIRLELGNSPQAQQIKVPANALLGAAEQFDREIKLRDQNLKRRQQTVRDVRRAYQPVSEALTQPGLNTPGAQRIAERIGLKIVSLEDAMGIPRKPPETPIEVRIQRTLVREYTGIIAEMDTFMAGLNDKVPEGPLSRNEALALRDAVRKLRRFTAQGAPDRRMVQELATAVEAQRVLLARVERVNQGRPPGLNVLRLRYIGEALVRIQAAATMP